MPKPRGRAEHKAFSRERPGGTQGDQSSCQPTSYRPARRAPASTLSNGESFYVLSGGTDRLTTLNDGGTVTVCGPGTTVSSAVNARGEGDVMQGTASFTTVDDDASL